MTLLGTSYTFPKRESILTLGFKVAGLLYVFSFLYFGFYLFILIILYYIIMPIISYWLGLFLYVKPKPRLEEKVIS